MQKDDAPRLGPLQQRSNLGISPQTSLEGVSQSSPNTKKNQDFQYLKNEGRSVTILAFLTQGTSS